MAGRGTRRVVAHAARGTPVAAVLLLVIALLPPGAGPSAAGDTGGYPEPAFTFSPAVLVDDGAGNSWGPTLAIDGGSVIHLAWSDDRGGFRRIYYARSTDLGTTWSPDADIGGTTGTGNAVDPVIGVDRSGGPYDGNLYVAWRETNSGETDVFLRRSADGGATWLPRARIDTAPPGIPAGPPGITTTPGGQVFVAWYDTRNSTGIHVFVTKSGDGGATWSPEAQVTTTARNHGMVSLAAADRYVYLAYRELDPGTFASTLWVSRTPDLGASWTAVAVDAGASPTDRTYPQLAALSDGTVQVAWIGTDPNGLASIRASNTRDNGTSWAPASRVDDATVAGITYRSPRIAEAGGDVYGVWADGRNGDMDVFFSTAAGLGWGDGIDGTDPRVDDTDSNGDASDDATEQNYPGIAWDGLGVYVAWMDRRAGNEYDLYFSRLLVQTVWITEVQDSPEGAEQVEITVYGRTTISFANYRLEIDSVPVDLSPLGTAGPGAHLTVGDPGTASLPVGIELGDEGGVLRVYDGSGALLDLVAYGQRGVVPDPLAGESVGRRWTGLKYSDDWTREAAPTWGGLNGVPASNFAPAVVLNEVLFNPAAPGDAFLELFYTGINPADLAGFVIAGDVPFTIPAATVTAADPYFVLRRSDAPALFASLDVAGDNVYLYGPSGAFQDMAGWSSPHSVGGSMARVPEGLGDHDAYDDGTALASGWVFDATPTIPYVILRQSQSAFGDLGETLTYPLTVTHRQPIADWIDLVLTEGANGWNASLVDLLGMPLRDHDGDGVPDTDSLVPGDVFGFRVRLEIPGIPPVGSDEVVVLTARASLTPLARSSVDLHAGTYPRIEPVATVDPDPVYVDGTPPPFPVETNLTLTIVGRGTALARSAPQDTILVLDRSGSLADGFCPGCFPLMKSAAKGYVDNLSLPDQAAVIYFTDAVIPKGPLTTNYARVKADIDSETVPFGGTQIGEAIRAANDELSARGDSGHFWAVILLTDGQDNPGGLDPLTEAQTSAAIGARVFTIGLGPSVDEGMLREIARITGGEYLHADSPQDLYGIYEKIGTLVDSLAGYDSDLTDDVPMVQVVIPPYIRIAGAPFVDPDTGLPRPAEYTAAVPEGTLLQWNVSRLQINESWSVRMVVRSTQAGVVEVLARPISRATYQRWDALTVVMPFPRTPLTVLGPPEDTVRVTVTRSPEAGTVVVDGQAYPAPAVFMWFVDSLHRIEVPDVDPFAPDSRYAFQGWSDGGARSHDLVAGPVNATYTAYFLVQHRPTVRLLGTDPAHDVEVRSVQRGNPQAARTFGTWVGWVDQGTDLGFDALAAGSGADERWATGEDFASAPWRGVSEPFLRNVVYYHQYSLRITPVGLSPSHPAPVSATAFGQGTSTPISDPWAGWIDADTDAAIATVVPVSGVERYATEDAGNWRSTGPVSATLRYYRQWSWRIAIVGLPEPGAVDVAGTAFGHGFGEPGTDLWTGWVDDTSLLGVDPFLSVGPRERYAARPPSSWTVLGAGDETVRYAHEMRPSVRLLGTDGDHSVGVRITSPEGEERVSGLHTAWSGWVEVGSVLTFDARTTGAPPRITTDAVVFSVESPFDASILYVQSLEVNYKPFLSAIFVSILGGVGGAVARGHPLRLDKAPRRHDLPAMAVRNQVKRDRRRTALLIILPAAGLEGAIGVLSYFTGFFRVPEEGSWVSLGLLVNAAILGAGLVGQIAARTHGYDAKARLRAVEARRAAAQAALRGDLPPPPSD